MKNKPNSNNLIKKQNKVTKEQLTRQKWKKSFKAKQQNLDSNHNKEKEID